MSRRRDASSFSLFHYEGSGLVAVESLNAPLDHMMARSCWRRGLSPEPSRLPIPQVPLKSLTG